MEVIKTNIPMKDVAKVMREVGYNKAEPGSRSSAIADQIAEANARPQKSMSDAINRAMEKVTPHRETVVLPKPPSAIKPAVTVKEAEKVVKDLKSTMPGVAVKAATKVLEEVGMKERKTVIIDMTTRDTKVTFTGSGWIPMNIRLANAELIRAFRMKIRDEYRKGIK